MNGVVTYQYYNNFTATVIKLRVKRTRQHILMSNQQQRLDQGSKFVTFNTEYILQSRSGVRHGADSLALRDWKLSFSDTNPTLITADEFTYILPVRLRSPPVNHRVENGVRCFDMCVPYFTDYRYAGVPHNYYAN